VSNLRAFLEMIALSEGTARIGDRGYNILVGSTQKQPLLFGSYHDHPRVKIKLRSDLTSTAAGRYQILARYFDAYRKSLELPDFSPDSQDAIATQMIREQGAYADVTVGRFDEAVVKVANIWASLPGNSYKQPQHNIAFLREAYVNAGGVLA
jgi:muramidase (phage lysozyme)